eukprot:93942_1
MRSTQASRVCRRVYASSVPLDSTHGARFAAPPVAAGYLSPDENKHDDFMGNFYRQAREPASEEEISDVSKLIFPPPRHLPSSHRPQRRPARSAVSSALSSAPLDEHKSAEEEASFLKRELVVMAEKMARVPELWRTTMSSPACQQIFQDFVSRVREPPEGLRQPGSDSAQVPCDPRIQYAAVGDSDSEPGSTALSPPTYGRFLAVLGLAPTTVTDLLSSAWKWLSSVVSGLTSVGHVAAATGRHAAHSEGADCACIQCRYVQEGVPTEDPLVSRVQMTTLVMATVIMALVVCVRVLRK